MKPRLSVITLGVDATAHLVLGSAWLIAGNRTRAADCFERATKLESRPDAAHLALGIAYRQSVDIKKARDEFDAALKARPDRWVAHYEIAETLVAAGQKGMILGNRRYLRLG